MTTSSLLVDEAFSAFGTFVSDALPLFYLIGGIAFFLFIFSGFTGVLVRGIKQLLKKNV